MNARSLHFQYAPENINIEAAKRIFSDENNPVAQLLRDEFVNEDAITAEKLATVLNTFLTTHIPMPSLEHLDLNRDALDALPRLQDKDKEVRKAARKTVKRAVVQELVPGITQKPEITVSYKKQTIPLYVLVKKIPARDGSKRNALMFTVIIPSDSKFPPAAPDGVSGEEWKNYVYGQVLGLAARKIYNELSDRHNVIVRKNILALLGMHDDKFEVKKLKLAGENAVLAANLPLATSNIFKYFDFEKIDTIAAMRTALAVPGAVFKKASRRTTRLDYIPADIFFRRHHHDGMNILFPGSKAQPLSPGAEEARTDVSKAPGRQETEIAPPAAAPPAEESGEHPVAGGEPVITSETLDTLDPYLAGQFVVNVFQTYNEEEQKKVKKQLLGGIKTAVIVHDRVPQGMTIDAYALQNNLVRIDKIPLTFPKELGGMTRYVREKAVAVYFRKRSRGFPLYVGETIATTADGVEMRAPVFHVIDDGITVIDRSKRPVRLTETRWNDALDMIILSHAAHRLIMMMISESQRYGRFQKLVAALAGIPFDTDGTVDVRPVLIKLDGYKAGLTAKAKLIVFSASRNGFSEIPEDIPVIATNNERFSLSGQEASLLGLGDPVDVQEVVNKYANTIAIGGLKKLPTRDLRPLKDGEEMKATASLNGKAPLVSGQRRVSKIIRLAINAVRGANLPMVQKMAAIRTPVISDGFLQKNAPEFHDTLSINLWNATDAALLAGPEAEIVEESGRSWYFHAEREKLKDTLRAQSGLGMPAVAFSLLKGDADTVDRLPRLAYAFSFPLFYQGKYHEMEVLTETVVSKGGQKSLILYLFDPKGTITRDGMPDGEDPEAWVRAIDGQVLALGAQEALARMRWDKFTGSAISRQMGLPYSRKVLTPGIIHLNGAETAAVLAVANTAGFSGDTSFGSAPFIARFEDDLVLTNGAVDALGLSGMPARGRDISMRSFAASFADRLLPSVLDSESIRGVLPSISNDLLEEVSGQEPENQEKVALLMARVPSRRKKVQAGVPDIKPGIVFSFALKDPGPFLHKTSLGSLKANLDDLAAAGPAIALVEDILNPDNPVQRGHPVFSVPVQYEGLRLKGNNRRKQQGTVQETVREEIRVALNVKGKHREDIATLFNYPVGNRTVSPEAIEEMIAMGFAGVQLDFTAGVQNLDEDALRKIRELNPDAIILFVPPADPAEKMQLQKVLASARLAATPVEPFRLGSLLAGIPENGNIGLRVYAEPDDAADDPEDIQQMESQLNDVIDSNARYVILPFGAHAGIVNANHLALREMVERLISRRVDSTKNIELREERAFRGGAAMARTLPVNVEELRTMLDALRDVRGITLPDRHTVTSHGLNIFASVRSYLTNAGEDAIDASVLTTLLFAEFDDIVEKTPPAMETSEYWQAMIDAVGDIRKRNGSEAAGLVFLAYMDGFLQEALARAYPKEGQFENTEYETIWKKLYLDMDSLLVRKEGRYAVLGGASDDSMETFMNMKMVEHLTVIGRIDIAEKMLIDTARDINSGKLKGTIGSLMFVEAVAQYLIKNNRPVLDLRTTPLHLDRQRIRNRDNQEFLFAAAGSDPSIMDAMRKVIDGYEHKDTLSIGEQAYYRNALNIMKKLSFYYTAQDQKPSVYNRKIDNLLETISSTLKNWQGSQTMEKDKSLEDFVNNSLYAAAMLSHNDDLLSTEEQLWLSQRMHAERTIVPLFLSDELRTTQIPRIISKSRTNAEANKGIRSSLQPLLDLHQQFGVIPMTLTENGNSVSSEKTADPVTAAGILEILQVRADRKVTPIIEKALNLSIEANKAILYAS
jgi:hypothetical protein